MLAFCMREAERKKQKLGYIRKDDFKWENGDILAKNFTEPEQNGIGPKFWAKNYKGIGELEKPK